MSHYNKTTNEKKVAACHLELNEYNKAFEMAEEVVEVIEKDPVALYAYGQKYKKNYTGQKYVDHKYIGHKRP